jgi:membrane protein DedA with SNARE-associated domain
VALFAATNGMVGQPPSWAVFALVGWATLQGRMTVAAAALGWGAGYTTGSSVMFALLARYGRGWLDRLLRRFGRDPDQTFARAERWFARHGVWSVFLARLLPGFGWMITVPAGLSGMRWLWFALATLAGSTIWALGLTLAARALGDAFLAQAEAVQRWTLVGAGVVTVAVLCWIVVRRLRRRR